MRTLSRSALYVPGDATDKLGRALGRGADALIVDLEDAVPPARKGAARAAVTDWLHRLPADTTTAIWIRVNPGELRHHDVRAVAGAPALTGLVLAKVESAADVADVAAQLTEAGNTTAVLMPLIETGGALWNARRIAAGARVHRLQVGELDLAADLGLEPGEDESELSWARSAVVAASRAAGVAPPLGPVSRITRDPDALAESTRRVRRLGYVGRACIHPSQIAVVHSIFTPAEAEVEAARRLVARAEAAAASGLGVFVDDDGLLVDEAVLRAARRTLELGLEA